MSRNAVDRDDLVRALNTAWSTLDELISGLSERFWLTPTCLPGWTVQDVVAHIVGTESMLTGRSAPENADARRLPHVHNEIGAANEQWVQSLRPEPPEQVRDRFREITRARRESLAAMTQADFDEPSWTPAGRATYGRFMRIRVFDCWMHEQDIRDAVGVPSHEDGRCAELAVDEIQEALGYLIGKRAGAPDGSNVTVELTGPVRRTVHVAVSGRASVVPEPAGPDSVRLRLPSSLLTRLAGGRVDPDASGVEIDGDTTLGENIVGNLGFTI